MARRLLELRQWERTRLPTFGTSIGIDVLLTLVLLSEDRRPQGAAVLKELYLSLPYSDQAVRLHLRRLERHGWITIRTSADDSRTRTAELSDQFWAVFEGYLARVDDLVAILSQLRQPAS